MIKAMMIHPHLNENLPSPTIINFNHWFFQQKVDHHGCWFRIPPTVLLDPFTNKTLSDQHPKVLNLMNFQVIDLIKVYSLSYETHHEDDCELGAFMPTTDRWRLVGWGREAAMDSRSVAGCVGPVLHQMYLATLWNTFTHILWMWLNDKLHNSFPKPSFG